MDLSVILDFLDCTALLDLTELLDDLAPPPTLLAFQRESSSHRRAFHARKDRVVYPVILASLATLEIRESLADLVATATLVCADPTVLQVLQVQTENLDLRETRVLLPKHTSFLARLVSLVTLVHGAHRDTPVFKARTDILVHLERRAGPDLQELQDLLAALDMKDPLANKDPKELPALAFAKRRK